MMNFRQIVPALLLLESCSQQGPPCPAVTTPREVTALLVSIVAANGSTANYRQEFASGEACEIARKGLHAEMEQLVERAKAVTFNQRGTQTDWTDYRGRYHPAPVATLGSHAYPDLIASCSSSAIASQAPDEPNQPIPLPKLQEYQSSSVPPPPPVLPSPALYRGHMIVTAPVRPPSPLTHP